MDIEYRLGGIVQGRGNEGRFIVRAEENTLTFYALDDLAKVPETEKGLIHAGVADHFKIPHGEVWGGGFYTASKVILSLSMESAAFGGVPARVARELGQLAVEQIEGGPRLRVRNIYAGKIKWERWNQLGFTREQHEDDLEQYQNE